MNLCSAFFFIYIVNLKSAFLCIHVEFLGCIIVQELHCIHIEFGAELKIALIHSYVVLYLNFESVFTTPL